MTQLVICKSVEDLAVVCGRWRRHDTMNWVRIGEIGLCRLLADWVIQFDGNNAVNVCDILLREEIMHQIHPSL